MTRAELVQILRGRFPNLPAKLINNFVLITFDSFTTALAQGRKIEIRGLGSFAVKKRKPHLGRDPRNNKPIEIDSKLRVIFKSSKKLQLAINPDMGNN